MVQELRQNFHEKGDEMALERLRLLQEAQNLTIDDREILFGYLEGAKRLILVEPQPLLTQSPKLSGLDGLKMSKSYGNTISMRENPDSLVIKLKKMPTDPARVKRDDPGDPENVQYGHCIKYIVQSRPLTGLKKVVSQLQMAA